MPYFRITSSCALGLSLLLLASCVNSGSDDAPGDAWTERNSDVFTSFADVTWGNSQFVAVSLDGIIMTSPDGVAWTTRREVGDGDRGFQSVVWTGTEFLAVGGWESLMASSDGVTWTPRLVGLPHLYLDKVILKGSQIAILAGDSTGRAYVVTSTNGQSWAAVAALRYDVPARGFVWTGSQFVVAGDDAVMTSSDGMTWTSQETPGTLDLTGLTWTGSQLVAVGYEYGEGEEDLGQGVVLTSADGIAWTAHGSGKAYYMNDAVSAGSRIVAVGHRGVVMTSRNGASWTSRTPVDPAAEGFTAVAWSGTRLVAVGSDGRIFSSP